MAAKKLDVNLDLTATVDLEQVKKFIESPKFTKFLVDNTTDINIALFILQELENKIKEYSNG